jgi:hypothetical protein
LVSADEVHACGGDMLGEEERAALHTALDEAEEDIKAGRVVSDEEMLRELGRNSRFPERHAATSSPCIKG